jgi:hypothetical protein
MKEIEKMLRNNPWYICGDHEQRAEEWATLGYDAEHAKAWVDSGIWEPEVAHYLDSRGVKPCMLDVAEIELDTLNDVCSTKVGMTELLIRIRNRYRSRI